MRGGPEGGGRPGGSRSTGDWRLLDPSAGIADGPTNMAVDAALLESVKADAAPALRLYRWSPATLSFGRNQPARDRYDRGAAADRGIAFVRRPTGGQAVLHDDELTYALVAPVSAIGKPRAAYEAINRALVEGLRRLGIRAAVVAEDAASLVGPPSGPDWDVACFRRPERGEVMVAGAKLVGSAQRVEDRVILQHGSILAGGSQAAAEELLSRSRSRSSSRSTPTPSPTATTKSRSDTGWTTVERELAVRPSYPELAEAVVAGFGAVFGVELEVSALTADERARVAELRGHFASEAWTWRR